MPVLPHRDRAPCPTTGRVRLQVIVDRGSVEVFVGDGEATVSSLSFPDDGARSAAVVAVGGAASIPELTVRELQPIW